MRLILGYGLPRYLLMYDTGRCARGEPWLRAMIEDELRQLGVQFAHVLNEIDDSDEGVVMDGLRSLFDSWEPGLCWRGHGWVRILGVVSRERRPGPPRCLWTCSIP